MTPTTRGDEVPAPVRAAAAWTWRLLLFVLAAVVVIWLFKRFALVVVPLAIALILSALLLPAVEALHQHFYPRSLAVFLFLLDGLGSDRWRARLRGQPTWSADYPSCSDGRGQHRRAAAVAEPTVRCK